MDMAHSTLVYFAKSWGLFYFMGLSLVVVVYACWPSKHKLFDDAARSILEDEDKPCQ